MVLGSPQILRTLRVGGKWCASGSLVTNKPGSLRDLETESWNLETEKRVHRIHGTLETGLHVDGPQPGGPHKGGRRITYAIKKFLNVFLSTRISDVHNFPEIC